MDVALGAIAGAQAGMVSLEQLAEIGLSASAARKRAAAGRFRRIHPGVYFVGAGPVTHVGRLWAAVLAAGPGAAVSHLSAAWLKNLLRSEAVHVTGAGRRKLAGVHTHVGKNVPVEIDPPTRLRVTTLERTLLDLAATHPACLPRAIHEAEFHRLLDVPLLEAQIAAHSGHRGVKALKGALSEYLLHPDDVEEGIEEEFLALVKRAGLPRPLTKVRIAGYELDFYWPLPRLAVELDGRRAHLNRRAFEHDRRRDEELARLAIRVVRVTPRRLRREARELERSLRALV